MTATIAVNVVVKASGYLVYEKRPRNRSEVVDQVLANTQNVFRSHHSYSHHSASRPYHVSTLAASILLHYICADIPQTVVDRNLPIPHLSRTIIHLDNPMQLHHTMRYAVPTA